MTNKVDPFVEMIVVPEEILEEYYILLEGY
jgi:hypothetical protein